MPLGTANNIGKTLGIAGDARDFIRTWRDAQPRPFDLGVVKIASQSEPFVEAVGGGIFGEVIAGGATVGGATIMGRETDRALHLLRSIAVAAKPAHWQVEVDGRDPKDGDGDRSIEVEIVVDAGALSVIHGTASAA